MCKVISFLKEDLYLYEQYYCIIYNCPVLTSDSFQNSMFIILKTDIVQQ